MIGTKRQLGRGGLLLAAALIAPRALAHDFWLEPSAFHAAVDELVSVRWRVGHGSLADPVARAEERIEKFVVVAAQGPERAIPGQDGRDPAGFFRPMQSGPHVIAYRSQHARSELAARSFEAYLREEGLEHVIEWRALHGASETPGREIYSRCAKALLAAGGDDAVPQDRVLGLRLELVATTSPSGIGPGEGLTVRLDFEGRPCPGVLVRAKGPPGSGPPASARTDGEGRASLTIAAAGPWVISAVHMIAAPSACGADWESLWASLAFEVPGGGPAPAKRLSLAPMDAVTVYCSSATALDGAFHDVARTVGSELARRGLTLVYGGGSVGLMGEVARATRAAGGRVVGVITRFLADLERADRACDELIVVEGMRERKAIMAQRGAAFLVLPGGIGTYEEFFEALVGRHLREHDKPIGVVNCRGYYNPLLAMIEHGVEHGFIGEQFEENVFVHPEPRVVIEHLLE